MPCMRTAPIARLSSLLHTLSAETKDSLTREIVEYEGGSRRLHQDLRLQAAQEAAVDRRPVMIAGGAAAG